MKWQSMKTAPRDGRPVLLTVRYPNGTAFVKQDWYPYRPEAIAWHPLLTPYTGTVEELDAEGGDA